MIHTFLKSTGYILLSCILYHLLWSCAKETECEKFADEEKSKLNNYLVNFRNEYDDVKELTVEGFDGKVYMHIIFDSIPDDTSVYNSNDFLIFDYLGQTIDGNIYETNELAYAPEWSNYQQYNYDHFIFSPAKLPILDRIVGFKAGVSNMNVGDQAIMVIPSSLAFNDCEHTTIIYTIKLHRIITDIIDYDSLQVDYFKTTVFNGDSTLSTGIYFLETDPIAPESDTIPKEVDSMLIDFEAYYLQENSLVPFDKSDGEIWISSSNIVSSKKDNILTLTSGFASAFDTIYKKSTYAVMVPYLKGYGQTGLRHSIYGYTIVPPYTSLYYTIKLIDAN